MDARVDPNEAEDLSAQRRRAAELREGIERAKQRLAYFSRERQRCERREHIIEKAERAFFRRVIAGEETAANDVTVLQNLLAAMAAE
jgi:hypothetical protein